MPFRDTQRCAVCFHSLGGERKDVCHRFLSNYLQFQTEKVLTMFDAEDILDLNMPHSFCWTYKAVHVFH